MTGPVALGEPRRRERGLVAIRAAEPGDPAGEAAFLHRFVAWAGCPQSIVVEPGEPLADGVAAVLDLPPAIGAVADGVDPDADRIDGRPRWRVVAGPLVPATGTAGEVRLRFPAVGDGASAWPGLPAGRTIRWRRLESVDDPATHAWYLALKHLDKTEALPRRSSVDRLLADLVLRSRGADDLAAEMARAGRRHEPLPRPDAPDDEIAATLERMAVVSDGVRGQLRDRRPLPPATFAAAPELLAAAVLRGGPIPEETIEMALEAPRGARQVAMLLAAVVLAGAPPARSRRFGLLFGRRGGAARTRSGDPRRLAAWESRLWARLHRGDLFDEARAVYRSVRDAFAASPSPVVAAVVALGRRGALGGSARVDPAWRPARFEDETVGLGWTRLAEPIPADAAAAAWTIAVGDDEGRWFDPGRRLVARGMLDVARRTLDVPWSTGGPIEIDDAGYLPVLPVLREAWASILWAILRDADAPRLRIRPWPAGFASALSMRYDVDRPIDRDTVVSIVEGQRRDLGAACGTWYELPPAWPGSSMAPLEPGDGQERGCHATRGDDALAGRGVTTHSAPGSEYWAGRRSVDRHRARGAAWTEHLAAQVGIPVPARDESEPDDRSGWPAIALTPLHFPLEGATSDTGPAYFDRWIDAFRTLRSLGGHLIPGTHPDVDQGPIDAIAPRERLDRCWAAPTGAVVARVAQLLAADAIRVAALDGGEAVELRRGDDRPPLDDVVVEFETPSLPHRPVVLAAFAGGPIRVDRTTPRAPAGVDADVPVEAPFR